MKKVKWQALLGILLIFISLLIYSFQINLFHDPKNTWFYFFQDMAFVPIQVLLVTLIIDQLLSGREKRSLLNKMNMVIGTFFSECGTGLIAYYVKSGRSKTGPADQMLINDSWKDRDFVLAQKKAKVMDHIIESSRIDLDELRSFLSSKRDFLLRLLENPNLLEHDSFTDLLWAVFHLSEELSARKSLKGLSAPDSAHIAADIKRVFSLMVVEWLAYMRHLKKEYPYLYSLSVRMNPFDPGASAEIK